MMGKQNGQIQIAILDIDSMIPEDHLLRQIKDEVLTKFFRLQFRLESMEREHIYFRGHTDCISYLKKVMALEIEYFSISGMGISCTAFYIPKLTFL